MRAIGYYYAKRGTMRASKPITAALLGSILGLTLLGPVAPAAASDHPMPTKPSLSARAAAQVVQEYLGNHTRPAWPGQRASNDAYAAYADAEYEFFRGYPFDAGIAQWDCKSLGLNQVTLYPAAEGRPAATFKSFGLDCFGGYQPTSDEVFTIRQAALAATEDPAIDRVVQCQTIAGGSHCISFAGGIVRERYTWLGNLVYGRVRVGMASVVWPSCNTGSTLATTPVHALTYNQSIVAEYPHPRSANWSLTFDQADSGGTIVGIRSVFCEAG